MTLTFVGAGLFDERDISIKGYLACREADVIYLEDYTSKLFGASLSGFEELFEEDVVFLSREEVEQQKKPLEDAGDFDVVFLVPGDPMISTTHVDLRIEANDRGIETEIIHGSSIYTAAPGLSGLQNYKFGRSATVTFKKRCELPKSPYRAIRENKENGLHTLLFLDIEAKRSRYMDPAKALELLRQIEEEEGDEVVLEDTEVVVVSRAGSGDVGVKYGEVGDLICLDFGCPLHTLIFPGDLHFREKEALEAFG